MTVVMKKLDRTRTGNPATRNVRPPPSLDAGGPAGESCAVDPALIRPFYLVGHNPNRIEKVLAALDAGANAIEPDVNVFEHDGDALCINHGEGGRDAPSLVQFLSDLHAVAAQRPALSLVVFDCKPKVATPEHTRALLDAVRTHLTRDQGTALNVVISVASLSEARAFDGIRALLGPREGLMVDEENDPSAVASFFAGAGVEHRCYGNGTPIQNAVVSPHLRPAIEKACALRAGEGAFRFIYEWTNNDAERMREFIRTGVDGIITDEMETLLSLTREPEFRALVRLARREDNPFEQPHAGYALTVHTGDVELGGTDARLTFTLTGARGSISKTIDASLLGRMERDGWDFVTIPSPDLGELASITVERDDSGIAPRWFLDRIRVDSFRHRVSRQASFERWIDTTAPVTQPLR
jgi:glycerophosphoryl diester phosphodiesterase